MRLTTGELLKEFVVSVAPIMVSFAFGLILALNGILVPEHANGISTYIFYVGLPALISRRLALNDPSALDFSLLGADALSKLIPLLLLLLWWRYFSKYSNIESLEWVVTYFMLCTLPNTVLVGDSILVPMYGKSIDTQTTTIIFAQSLYWYNVCILLYEIRGLMLEDERKKASTLPLKFANSKEITAALAAATSCQDSEVERKIRRSLSAPSASIFHSRTTFQFSISQRRTASGPFPELEMQASDNSSTTTIADSQPDSTREVNSSKPGMVKKEAATDESMRTPVVIKDSSVPLFTKVGLATIIIARVAKRILKTPLLYASSGGFAYSLFALRYGWKMPTYISTTLSLLADGTIGMAMVMLGLLMASSIRSAKGVIACGVKLLLAGFAARFLIAPIIMYISSLTFNIKGTILHYSIVQVIVPQGTMSFALAKQYSCKLSTLTTATLIQILVFVPVILAYYAALDAL